MRKISALFVMVALMSVTFGCQSMANGAPGAMPLGDIATGATYDVIGPVEGSAEGWVIFGIFALGVPNQGAIAAGGGGGLPGLGDPVKAAAEFDAIQSTDADCLLAPRHHSDITNYFIAKKQKTRVWGKAAKIN